MLIKALSDINNFSEEKKADYQMLFAAFDTDYQYYKSQFTSAKVRIAFFSRLMTELLSAEEFFRLCPLPNPRKDATKPYINDKVFAADCVAWEKTAENIAEYFGKGNRILIQGRLSVSSYEQNGEKRKSTKVQVFSFEFIDSKNSGNSQNGNRNNYDDDEDESFPF